MTAKRRWRDFKTAASTSPFQEFVDLLTDADASQVAAAMRDVAFNGIRHARHLHGEIYEVRADGDRQIFRILFAQEGKRGQILLALDGFSKKTQKTPPAKIALVERRLADWRSRGNRV